MILQGRNLIIKLNGTAIAASKSCSINVTVKTTNVASATDGEWEHKIADRKSWSINTSYLLVAASTSATPLTDAISRVGQTYTISFECRELSSDTMSGTAICKTFKTSGSIGNLLSGSYEWTGTGPLSAPEPEE